MYYCCLAFTKFSILAFYGRVFPVSELGMTTHILIDVMTAWWITAVLVSMLSCPPVEYDWVRTKCNIHCVSACVFVLRNFLPDVVTDVAILQLPLPVIRKLQLRVKKKMTVTAILPGYLVRSHHADTSK